MKAYEIELIRGDELLATKSVTMREFMEFFSLPEILMDEKCSTIVKCLDIDELLEAVLVEVYKGDKDALVKRIEEIHLCDT